MLPSAVGVRPSPELGVAERLGRLGTLVSKLGSLAYAGISSSIQSGVLKGGIIWLEEGGGTRSSNQFGVLRKFV